MTTKKSKESSPSRTGKRVNVAVRAGNDGVREELCNADLRKFANVLAKAAQPPKAR